MMHGQKNIKLISLNFTQPQQYTPSSQQPAISAYPEPE